MNRLIARFAATAGFAATTLLPGPALSQAAPQPIKVCPLVSKADVKKNIPWKDVLDQMPVDEEAVGTTGSSCNYPTVHVQVLAFRQSFIDTMGKDTKLDPVSGVGDAAWFRNNKNRFAELAVKVGPRLLTLQADIPDGGTIESVKPGMLNLAKLYVGKLR